MALAIEEATHEIGVENAVLEALTRGEIDVQIRTAKTYPRSIKKFMDEARDMACLDEDTAASCIFALPRGGTPIEGPSVRLAEIVASAWGNCRAGARVVSEEQSHVTAQGAFFDVERNVAIAFEVRRKILDSKGRRYNEDMISMTANAACSIALRNAVFKGVPKAFWGPVYDAARKTAVGDAKTLEARRADLVNYFGKMGVTPDRLLAAVGKTALEDVGADQLGALRGIATAIKEGEITIEAAFPAPTKEGQPTNGGSNGGSKADSLAAKLKQDEKPTDPAPPATNGNGSVETKPESEASAVQPAAETSGEAATETEGTDVVDYLTRLDEAEWKCAAGTKKTLISKLAEYLSENSVESFRKALTVEFSKESPADLTAKEAVQAVKLVDYLMTKEKPAQAVADSEQVTFFDQ